MAYMGSGGRVVLREELGDRDRPCRVCGASPIRWVVMLWDPPRHGMLSQSVATYMFCGAHRAEAQALKDQLEAELSVEPPG